MGHGWRERRGPAAVRGHPYGLAIGADGDGAVYVAAKDLSAHGRIAVDHHRVRMAKATVAPHRKHRHAWVDDTQILDLTQLVALTARLVG